MATAEVSTRLASPMALPEKAICAAWCLQEEDPQKRMAGLRALIPERGPVEAALRDLAKGDRAAEYAALPPDGLVAEMVCRLLPQLRSDNETARAQAVHLLGLLARPEAVPALSGLVSDPDLDVRRAVVAALQETHDQRALEPLIKVARGPNPFIGDAAVYGVAEIGGPRAREALVEIMDS